MFEKIPEIGDRVSFDDKTGFIVAFCDEDGAVDDGEDAIALTIAWSDGSFSALLITDLEFVREQ